MFYSCKCSLKLCWWDCIRLENCLSSRFMSVILWHWTTHLVPMLSQNAYCGWGAWCQSLSFGTPFSNSAQFSRSVVSDSLRPYGLQHTRPPCPSPTHVHWVSDAIQPSHPLLPLLLPPSIFPSIRSFPMSQFFASGGQSIGVSASASVLPMNIQEWFPLGWTGWISSQSKGLPRVFPNTTVQKHQFFGFQLSLWSNSHIHTWLLEKP